MDRNGQNMIMINNFLSVKIEKSTSVNRRRKLEELVPQFEKMEGETKKMLKQWDCSFLKIDTLG